PVAGTQDTDQIRPRPPPHLGRHVPVLRGARRHDLRVLVRRATDHRRGREDLPAAAVPGGALVILHVGRASRHPGIQVMSAAAAIPTAGEQARVRVAARALARAGLAHAYGHCSLRLDAGHFLVCAARPMGLIAPDEPGVVVPVHGELPAGVLGEVRIHQQIYRARPEVGGVARTMPPTVMALSAARVTPAPRHGMGSYFWPAVPLWDDPLLVRSDAQALGVARALGEAAAVVIDRKSTRLNSSHVKISYAVF